MIEDDATRIAATAADNVHSTHNHLHSSSDSDFFIRMDVQPRNLLRDYLSTATSASLSALRHGDDDVGFDLEEDDEEKGVEAGAKANYCSGCGSSSSSNASASSITLSYLQPCQHAICHQCFTGMLNIVGEKGLECPMCKGQVTSFDVQVDSHHQPSSLPSGPTSAKTTPAYHSSERKAIATAAGATTKMRTTTGQAPTTPTFASVLSAKKKTKAAGLATADDVFSTATPSRFAIGDISLTPASTSTTSTDPPVLRIDNLPWVNVHPHRPSSPPLTRFLPPGRDSSNARHLDPTHDALPDPHPP